MGVVVKIVVMGQGYVGLPLAMAAAKAGHNVVGFEPDEKRCESLKAGTSYVEDVHNIQIQRAQREGLYTATSNADDLKDFDLAVITVPTPLHKGTPDLTYVRDATCMLGIYLSGGATVVLESTTYPGTTRDVVIPLLETASELIAGEDFHVGFSPERIDPGNKTWNFGNTPKIVSGLTPECLNHVKSFYQTITATVVPADSLEEAETAKVFENTFRQVNIALVNELQRHAHTLGVDVYRVLDLAETKPFGFTKFTPGPGVGGHCIPCDPQYLAHHLRQLGEMFRIVELAQEINESQPAYVVQRLQDALNDRLGKALRGSRILALGQSYKPGTADMRESPAVEVAELLRRRGALVDTVDPFDTQNREVPYDRLTGYDAVLVLTPHTEFDLSRVADSGTFVLDTRGMLASSNTVERL